jgi:hypothetical protein
LDICVHYSVNANYNHTPEASFTILTNFCLELAELRCSLLLVSGGGPRKRLNSLAVGWLHAFTLQLIRYKV